MLKFVPPILSVFFTQGFLLRQLTLKEIKARYKQSILGYAWVVANPLAQLLVYTFVFSVIVRFPTDDIPYALFLSSALLSWNFFQSALSSSTVSLVDHSALLRKIYFPREIIPYSTLFAKLIDLLFSFIILIGLMLFFQTPIHLSVLFIIPILLFQLIFMMGLSLILSASNLFYRDIQYLANLLFMLWFYLSPVVYPLSQVPEKYHLIYRLNPMGGFLEAYRAALFHKPFDMAWLGWSMLCAILTFFFGYYIFKKMEKVFADIV